MNFNFTNIGTTSMVFRDTLGKSAMTNASSGKHSGMTIFCWNKNYRVYQDLKIMLSQKICHSKEFASAIICPNRNHYGKFFRKSYFNAIAMPPKMCFWNTKTKFSKE